MRATAAAALLALLALSGCETTAERSAQLEKTAHHTRLAERGLSIARQSTDVHVLSAILVHGSAGAAAVVTLRNDSGHTLDSVPIAITVKDSHGSTVFQNNAPGLETALTSLGSLSAHGVASWVDDQVPATGDPASVTTIVGEPPAASGPLPLIEIAGVHPSEESGSATAAGNVGNRSNVIQQNLIVYVLARKDGKIVAAGRAVLAEVQPDASVPFQVFFVGDAKGAKLEASAPPTTLG